MQVAGTRLGVFVEAAAALLLAHVVSFRYSINSIITTSDLS